MEAIFEFGAMLLPLYVSGIYNAVKLSEIQGKQTNCIYCQKSDEIIKREVKEVN